MSETPVIRLATPADCTGAVELIGIVFREFGYVASGDHGERDVAHLDQHYFGRGGAFWVLDAEGGIAGTHAALPGPEEGVCTFRRLYLHEDYRGSDYGRQLMQVAIDWARDKQMRRVEFWSDIKFNRAHRFFDKFGFVKTEDTRSSHDGLQPYDEARYYLELS